MARRTPLYIFDLDGTLALIDHRRPLVERPACPHCGWHKACDHSRDGTRPTFKPDWDAFYAACVKDQVNKPVAKIFMTLLRSNSDIQIFSGRSEAVREQSEKWLLEQVGVYYDEDFFHMRPVGDFTPDDVLKRQWYENMLDEDKERLVAVFDDRDRVVKMWRDLGVTCLQVAPGDF